MKKRGFTLIELLGVIIILGLLGVIATPIIMEAVENSKENSALRSAEQLIKAATLDYTKNDNFTTKELDVLSFEYEGDKPESGYIQFNENEKARLYMLYNGYCVVKRFDSELIAVKLDGEDICDWYTTDKTIRTESTDTVLTINDLAEDNLLNYKIYGNSYQETRSGKNLFDYKQISNSSITLIENGIRITNSYATSTGITPEEFLEMTGLKEGDTATISRDVNIVSGEKKGSYGLISFIKKNAAAGITIIPYGRNKNTFTIPEGFNSDNYFGLYVYGLSVDGVVDIINIQIEKGTEVTEYEEYGLMPSSYFPSEVQSLGTLVTDNNSSNYGKYEIQIKVANEDLAETKEYSIYLDDPLRCIDDVCDYIDYGNSSVVRKIGVQELLPTSNIKVLQGPTTTDTELYRYYFKPSPTMKYAITGTGNGYSTVGYKAKENYNKWITPYQLYFGLSDQYISVVTDVEISNYQAFYNYLSNNGSSNVIFYFELAESYNTPINGLPKIKTFEGTNKITVSGGNVFASKIELIATKK